MGSLEVILVLIYAALFELGLGPIVWIYMSETMTDKGQSFGTLANWIATIIIAIITPKLIDTMHGYFFILLGAFCFLVCACW